MIGAPFVQPGGPSPWVPLLTTDQGTAPFDPAGFSAPGTVFDPATGLFTWVMNGDTTQVDGYRENQVRWTRSLSALYPDLAATDIVDLAMAVSIPFTTIGTERYGLALEMLDGSTATIGAANGLGYSIYPTNLVAYQTVGIGTTGTSATDSFTGIPNLVAARFHRFSTGGLFASAIARNTLSAVEPYTGAFNTGTFSADPSTWRIHIGHVHFSTVSAAPTMTARVFHRRTKASGLVGLP